MNDDRSSRAPHHSVSGGLAPGGDVTGAGQDPAARDRALRRATRLRQVVVGGSVAASFAVAAAVGSGVLGSTTPVAASATTSTTAGASSSTATGSGSSATSSASTAGVSLSAGSGSSHASSGGS